MTHKYKFLHMAKPAGAFLSEQYDPELDASFVIRIEFGSDGKPLNAQIVPKGDGSHEPTFTLRATDIMAAHVVRLWAGMASLMDINREKVISAESVAQAMDAWRGPKKKAD